MLILRTCSRFLLHSLKSVLKKLCMLVTAEKSLEYVERSRECRDIELCTCAIGLLDASACSFHPTQGFRCAEAWQMPADCITSKAYQGTQKLYSFFIYISVLVRAVAMELSLPQSNTVRYPKWNTLNTSQLNSVRHIHLQRQNLQ